MKKVITNVVVTLLFSLMLIFICMESKIQYPDTQVSSEKVYNLMNKITNYSEEEIKSYALNEFRKAGLTPYFSNKSYSRDFYGMTPVLSETPTLYYYDSTGKKTLEYEKDFKVLLGGGSRSGDGSGNILYTDTSISVLPKEKLKGSILLLELPPSVKDINYAYENGIKAIVLSESLGNYYDNRDLNLKTFTGTPIYYVNSDIFGNMKNAQAAGFSLKFTYENSKLNNIAGYIQGQKDESVIFSSYSLSGISYMLELMDNIKASKIKPYYTVVFTIMDNRNGETQSSKELVNSIKNKNTDKFVLLGAIGFTNLKQIGITTDKNKGFQMSKMIELSNSDADTKISATNKNVPYGYENIKNSGMETLYYRDEIPESLSLCNYNTSPYVLKATDKASLANDIKILGKFNRLNIYNKDYQNTSLKAALILLLCLAFPYYIILILDRIKNEKLEYIKYLLNLIYKYLFLIIMIILFICIIGCIPKDILIKNVDGKLYCNYPFGVIINNVFQTIWYIFSYGFGSINGTPLILIAKGAFLRSSELIFGAIFISLFLGIFLGLKNGIKGKESSGSIIAIVLLSIPDVLILTCILILIAFLEKEQVLQGIFGNSTVKTFIMPLICTTILPTVYIWRMAYTACIEEYKKDYVRNAKGMGIKGIKLAFKELLPGVLLKVLKSMPSVIIMLMSNLILTEYLYYYPGIAFNLFAAYNHGDTLLFILYCLCFCTIYIFLTLIFKIWAVIIDPYKYS